MTGEENGWDESKQLVRHLSDTNVKEHKEIKDSIVVLVDKVDDVEDGITGKLTDISDSLQEMKLQDAESRTTLGMELKSLESRVSRMEKALITITTGIVMWALNQVLNLI